MSETAHRAIAVVGVGAILPDAPNAPAYWQNIKNKRYSIYETPPERWSIADYYDPDPLALDKTYSKIGGWVQGFQFDWKRYRIPPRVAAAMDQGQQWAVTIAAEALADYGYPERPLNTERTGVILGTAMGGENHYITTMRIQFPEYRNALQGVTEFQQLPAAVRDAILGKWHERMDATLPPITEDTMPGELPNIVSGRVANVLNLRGPNFITDAACASSFAAINAAVELLTAGQVDAVITGGVDRNMGASIFVKFCKIGALSATGSRPFGDGADGFVMGEGSAAFLLKRLADAERDGDKIYGVIRGVGGSADGKGKGITAPNPVGQILAAQRAWANAGLDPATATLVEAHGTSTKVGDVVELESLTQVFGAAPRGSIALGSAKGNIGHLKAGAGAAGLLKALMAMHDKVLPPTLNAEKPNPNADFSHSPFFLNHNLQAWTPANGAPRRAGVSSYGFGGTNFHVVLEEYMPGMLEAERETSIQVDNYTSRQGGKEAVPAALSTPASVPAIPAKKPVRGILAIGAANPVALKDRLDDAWRQAEDGWAPPIEAPSPAELSQPERLVIDFGDQAELLEKLAKARKAAGFDNPQAWKALSAQGIFRGSGRPAGKIAFLFPGQGSQYSNMGRELAALEPVVAETFREADAVMTPILGRPLTSYIFVDSADPAAMKQAERDLMQTAITQPAMLTLDTAFYKLMAEYGFRPDMVMGHSLGEYGALIAAGIMPFAHALEASAARGAEMTKVSMDDNGWMAAVMAPYDVIMQTLAEIDGYVVAANINSYNQCVVGGASKAVEQAIERFTAKGFQAMRIPVSHAFHTKIVAPASKPLRKVLDRLSISEPALPLVANVTGEIYPTTVEGIKDILELQIASPVQWVQGLETMYREGCRVFVEVGPKKALKGFVDDVLGSKPDVVSLFTNHPKTGELASFNQALCGLYAAGYGVGGERSTVNSERSTVNGERSTVNGGQRPVAAASAAPVVTVSAPAAPQPQGEPPKDRRSLTDHRSPVTDHAKEPVMSQPSLPTDALGQLAQLLQQALASPQPAAQAVGGGTSSPQAPYDRNQVPLGSVVISGTGLGLPGPNKPLMDPDNALRILRGEQFIDLIPERFRQRILDKRITRLVKAADGAGSFQVITDPAEVLKLAGRAGQFDLAEEYGVPAKLVEALDITTQYAFAAGLDALREAGIPLVQSWRKTTTGKFLPDRWMLPDALRDETGVIFASAFPGGDRFAEEFAKYYQWENRRMQLAMLEDLRGYTSDMQTLQELSRRIGDLREQMEREPYNFDRRFIFRILSMGHSQFAEYIGARGPNAHVNAACASTAQGIALAEDWIRNGRCRRVLVLGGDAVTSDNLMEWVGAGFLALGASATDDRVDEAALPFDRRRHGTILGMGACGLMVESEDAVRERGMRGIVELLSSETMNSAFHGSRLDVDHISQVMESLVAAAERRFGVNRYAMASQTVFMSHETYTPARGGSASAEVIALRNTFGDAASDVVVANTKGFTGHPMGVGVEDVIAVKILEYGIVPPVPNFKEVDPDLGVLNLSRGGRYPVLYALHLAAGFGSQIALTLTRRIPGGLDRVDDKLRYQHWLDGASGYDRAELEVIKRNLRIKSLRDGSQSLSGPGRAAAPSSWRFGIGPSVRAAAPGDGNAVASYHPQPMPAVRELLGKPAVDTVTRWQGDKVTAEAVMQPSTPAPKPVAVPVVPPVTPELGQAVSVPAPVVPTPSASIAPVAVATREPAPSAPITDDRSPAIDSVASQVLGIVAEKTGYPSDMLDLDLDLEADLGIDTVKQAETFQAVREAFSIPQQEGMSLRDYPTLESVIGFVHKMRPDLADDTVTRWQGDKVTEPTVAAPPAASPVPQSPGHPVTLSSDAVSSTVLGIVADKTGYPKDMLDLDLDLEADLGIDTVKQAETFQAVREAFSIPQQEGMSLRDYPTLESVIGFVHKMRPDLADDTVTRWQGDKVTEPTVAAPPAASPVTQSPGHPVTLSSDGVAATVLAIVAAKTGYPEDMLELDLDLEADLGIDTVKQAETFQAIREAYNIPFQEALSLRDYPTLQSVIGFVYTMRPDLADDTVTRWQGDKVTEATVAAPPAASPVPQSPGHPVTLSSDGVAATVLGIVAAKTGYPEDMLELDLDLEADLGIDTVKQAETFQAIREAYHIPFQENLALRDYPTLQSVIGFVYTMRPDLADDTVTRWQGDKVTEATVAAPPAASPVPQSPGHPVTLSSDGVAATVLGIVAGKTGYPEDMLELDLDLEADLGIDTVKQAETFQAIREAYNIPFQEALSLRDYPTLQSVIGFVYTMRPDLADDTVTRRQGDKVTEPTVAAPSAASPVTLSPGHSVTLSAVQTIGTLEDADRMPRRVPVPSLRPAIEFTKPTGVTLGSGSRVVVMLDRGGVGKALVNRLEKLGAAALTMEPGIATDALEAQLKGWLAEGPIQGVYWLPALDVEPAIEAMSLEEWREHNRIRVKNLYTAMRALYDSVRGPNTFLVSATRLGGLHGYGDVGATAPLGGAVSGFTKAYNMEQALRAENAGKGITVKVVDFEAGRKTAEPADALLAETLYDPGIVEVGYKDGLRYTVTLVEKPARDGQPGMALGKETVFVVTGAAGGITSAITTDLAVHSGGGVFYLLDLVQAPARGDSHVKLFREGREVLKQALIAEARASGEKVTPKQIDDKMMGIERGEAALRAVETVEAAGGVAHYFSLDLRDGDKVAAVVDDIRQRYGKIDVLLHAGGLLIDRTLPNKEPHQFALVFDVKADGFFSLMKAAKGLPIGATVSFSSVAGRFGNNGQSDYSSANDLLCKISSSMRAWRPETRGIAIDWTAWGQIGMASRGSVPAIMAALGIDMLPADAGVPTIRRELTYGGTRGEIVVAGRLGAWMEERDATGGVDLAKINAALAQRQPRLLMVGEVKATKLYGGIEVETLLDPHAQPFLYDHAPDVGTPWLPGVMATEALAELATVLAPGYRVAAVENEQMLGAFKFFRMEPRSLYLSATITPDGDDLVAHAVLRSVTKPAKEGLPVQVKEHFIADVRLTRAEGADTAAQPTVAFGAPADADLPIAAAEIYQSFFHGPTYQVIERAGVQGNMCLALMAHDLPPNTAPADVASLLAPRLVELCFQAAALWHVKTHNAMAFPLGFSSVTAYRQPEEAAGRRLYGMVQTNDNGDTFDAQVVDEAGNLFVDLKGYRTVGRPG